MGNIQPLCKTSRMIFDLSPDGKRFLVYKEAEDQPGSAITIVTNWSKALQK